MNNSVCLASVSQVWVCGYFCHSNHSTMGDPGPGSGAMDTLLHLVDSEQDRTSAKTSFFPSDLLQISKSKQKGICMFSCCHSKLMNFLRSWGHLSPVFQNYLSPSFRHLFTFLYTLLIIWRVFGTYVFVYLAIWIAEISW